MTKLTFAGRPVLLMAVFCILFGLLTKAQAPGKISLDMKNVPLTVVLAAIEKQTGTPFIFNRQQVEKVKVVSASYQQKGLTEVLDHLLGQYQFGYKLEGGNIILFPQEKKVEKRTVANSGLVSGKIMDEENGDAIAGATIKIGSNTVVAGLDGVFSVKLPAGNYAAIVSNVGYQKKQVTDIVVKEQEVVTLDVTMKREKGQLENVVVVASARRESVNALYTRQKNNAAITDGISAEQIRRTPDNNAAQVLKRISGVTVQDDKFVTIRGLSERYNNVLLNGATLPSTEPNRRNFAFDIIPGALIDNIVVHKTATPDMPSEFSGGLVLVNTKDIPAENYFTISAGSGFNTNTIHEPFYSFKRGKYEMTGFADKSRTWWTDGWDTDQYRKYTDAKDRQHISEMGRAIPNNFGLREYDYLPVQNLQLALGRKIKVNKKSSLGITLAGSHRHEENKVDEMRYIPTEFHYPDSSSATYQFNSTLAGVANIAWQNATTKLVFKNLYNRRLNNKTTYYRGHDDISGGPINMINNVLLINTLLHNRLEGEHSFGTHKIKIDWSADLIQSNRDQPDTRSTLQYPNLNSAQGYYSLAEGTGLLTHGINVFNSKLKETKKIGAVNITIPFSILGNEQKIKAGYSFSQREADFRSLGLRLYWDGTPPQDKVTDLNEKVYGLPDYELTTAEFLQPGLLYYRISGVGGQGKSFEDYVGEQRLHAPYLMADLKLLKRFRLVGGMRMENNYMKVQGITFDYNTGLPADSTMTYNTVNWLPSANLTYNLNRKMNIRLAWSKTLARADFRERARFQYFDFDERTVYSGAQSLQDAGITNTDIRYEFYPGAGEVISASFFHKRFESPVELVASQGSSGLTYYYFNLRSSTSSGIELDFRKSLNFINPASAWLQRIYINGNASWMKSKVKYNTQQMLNASNGVTDGGFTELPPDSRNRALQGLSPYTINAGIGYFGEVAGIQFSYNRYGSRILIGGLYPWQDQYEAPRDVLDLQLSGRFLKKKLEVRLNLSDLLAQHFIIYQNAISSKPGELVQTLHGGPDQATDPNPNKDPKGIRYNSNLDYTRYKAFKGRNISFNLTYNF